MSTEIGEIINLLHQEGYQQVLLVDMDDDDIDEIPHGALRDCIRAVRHSMIALEELLGELEDEILEEEMDDWD